MDTQQLAIVVSRALDYHRAQAMDKFIESLRSTGYEAEDYQLSSADDAG